MFVERDGQLFERSDDGKEVKFSPAWERITFELKNARRLATREADELFHKTELQVPLEMPPKRVVLANAVFPDDAPRRLNFFDMEGSTTYGGPIRLDAHEAAEPHVMLWHWPESERDDRASYDGEGEFHISLHLPHDQMAWLWDEMGERPAAIVEVDVGATVYQHDYERFLAENHHRQDYYLARDERGEVRVAGLLVGLRVRDQVNSTHRNELDEDEEASKLPVEATPFERGTIRFLRWIVGLLVIAIILLAIKR